MKISPEDLNILKQIRQQQEPYIEHGYGMGDYSAMICPWCSGQSDECGNDPEEFNETNARATFTHEATCKLESAQSLLDAMITEAFVEAAFEVVGLRNPNG